MDILLDSSIYLHFLDRELRGSIKAKLDDNNVLSLVFVAVFLSMNNLYVGNSLLWENMNIFPNSVKTLLELEKAGEVTLLTNHLTIDEFVESRRQLYAHDKERYPMYFSDDLQSKPWGKSIFFLRDSTTEYLEDCISSIVKRRNLEEYGFINSNIGSRSDVLEILNEGVRNRNGQAITFKLFSKYISESGDNRVEAEGLIRRIISLLYTYRYMKVCNGNIISGIEGFQFFDSISKDAIYYDYGIHRFIFEKIGLINLNPISLEQSIVDIAQKKKHTLSRELLIELRSLLSGICKIVRHKYDDSLILHRINVLHELKSAFNEIFVLNDRHYSKLEDSLIQLLSICSKLSNTNVLFKEGYDEMKKMSVRKKVLLVTATLTELRILLSVLETKGISPGRFTSGNHTYFVASGLGINDVYIFKTEMGSSGVASSTISIMDAVKSLNPDYVIMAGIAFGLKHKKQAIGDILVSKQLWSYEPANITEKGSIPRGDKITASPLLLDRFEISSLKWEKSKVDFGLIVSGEKLVNSKEFVEELLGHEPEAIGGEMEGTGLMAVCQNVQKHWILIKAICDWGYRKSSDFQEKAAINAMEYIVDTIANYLD